MFGRIASYLHKETSIAPLISLRVLFGFIMAVSVVRFMANGWVYDLYIKPTVFFPYYGFEWVKPFNASIMYILFLLMLVAALGIMLGLYYRLSAVLFFLSFTYIELIDKTNYLNHYYFVSLISFLLIFVPAHRSFSLDVWRHSSLRLVNVPRWCIEVFKFQLAIVYIYAGIAKLNPEWLFDAMPLRIWLPAHNHIPFIGSLFSERWVAYAFSWFGAAYDLLIVFFLFYNRTRVWAYGVVVAFHLITWWLFPIGMFPFIMILATLVFFSSPFHQRFIAALTNLLLKLKSSSKIQAINTNTPSYHTPRYLVVLLAFFFVIQVIAPWRFTLYPGYLFWTEEGYRFSWRVMLMEKAGYVTFHVKDPDTNRVGDVMPGDYLTPIQEKMMSTQPDMILQFAHFLYEEYKKKGIREPEIRADAYVTLNGRGTKMFIDPSIDLSKEKEGFHHKDWILSLSK